MKATGVDLEVIVELRFTDDELRVLGACSDLHYDYTCQKANFGEEKILAMRGDPVRDLGIIVKMTNYHRNTATPTAGPGYRLKWGEIDTLTKICEMGFSAPGALGIENAKIATGLMFNFKRLFEHMSAVRAGCDNQCKVAVGLINESIK